MGKTASDVMIETLLDWEVDTIFGIPGDGINGIIESLRTRQGDIRFIQVRHEEAAAFAACAYAKFTGRLGVCLATSGPGGVHLLNGIYDAKLDGQPVLAITGLQFHDLISTLTQQDVELDKLFADSCAYSARIMGPAHVENVVELACRTALAYRTPAHITMPVDVQSMTHQGKRSKRNRPHHVSNEMAEGAHAPAAAALAEAAAIINESKRPFILAGRGALGARAELEALAERIGAPVGMPLLGKGAIPDESPYAVGGVGLLGTRPAVDALAECDGLIIVGSSFPYIEFYPKPDDARGVQIDIDAKRIGLRFPVEAGLVGDSARTLRALLPLLSPKEDRRFLEKAQEGMEDWRKLIAERAARKGKPMKPEAVTHALNPLLDDDAIVITDSGTITTWVARHIDMRGTQQFSCSGTLASMACGLPYAIGAAVAFPRRQVVAVIGDGSAAMLMGDFVTLAKYGLDAKIIVIKNDTLGQIKWEQMVFLGNPEYGCELEPIDFVRIAQACGIRGVHIDDPETCAEQLRDALATPGPALIEAVVDPHEPPMPPKVKPEQALHFAESLAKGTPHRGKIAMTVASNVVREIV